MNDEGSVSTVAVLLELGFAPDTGGTSGLAFDFGNFKLTAIWGTKTWGLNMFGQKVMLFLGHLVTKCGHSEIDFEMPLRIASREQCAAWIVYHLDRAASMGVFQPSHHVPWVEDGRRHQDQLPWIKEIAECEARPLCMAHRDWFRVALKKLRENLAEVDGDKGVVFSFADSLLTIRCEDKVVAFPAEGRSWDKCFSIPAGRMRLLARRLMSEWIEVSVWKGRLYFGGRAYTGVVEVPETQDHATSPDPQRGSREPG